MPNRGGKRPGAGRKKGSPNKANAARVAAATKSGLLPHEFLLAVCRGEKIDGHKPTFDERIDAASKAAPFYAARLATTTHTGAGGGPIQHINLKDLTDEQLLALEPVLRLLAETAEPEEDGE